MREDSMSRQGDMYSIEDVAREVRAATQASTETVARLTRENEALHRMVAQLHSQLRARQRMEEA
jgi:hypothetical protein